MVSAAHQALKSMSVIRKTAAVIPIARKVVPAIASRFEVRSICSLSRSRQRRRWYAEGAISRIDAAAVAMKATKKTSRWRSVTRVQPLANGTASRNANSDLHPGERDAELVQELDQLAVEILAAALASPEEVALGRHHELARAALAARVDAADDGCRHAVGLPHHELRGTRELVGDRDHRRVELVAGRVAQCP